MNILARVTQARASMAVKRYHIMRMVRQQTVGEHSGAVATLMMQLDPTATGVALMGALTHDFHERATGDVPSTAKSLFPKVAAALTEAEESWEEANGYSFSHMNNYDKRLLKFCDYTELLLWCVEEYKMGNSFALEGVFNIIPAIEKLGCPNKKAEELFSQIKADLYNIGVVQHD